MKRELIVRSLSHRAVNGVAEIGAIRMPCALGRGGMIHQKREGDGATPIGRWRIEQVLYRPDRVSGLYSGGTLRHAKPLQETDGWCDEPANCNYNRAVQHPYPASAERLWRADHLYDVIVVLGHNRRPRVRGGGSAIFMHLARLEPDGGMAPTAGCVALARRDLGIVLRHLGPGSSVRVVG